MMTILIGSAPILLVWLGHRRSEAGREWLGEQEAGVELYISRRRGHSVTESILLPESMSQRFKAIFSVPNDAGSRPLADEKRRKSQFGLNSLKRRLEK